MPAVAVCGDRVRGSASPGNSPADRRGGVAQPGHSTSPVPTTSYTVSMVREVLSQSTPSRPGLPLRPRAAPPYRRTRPTKAMRSLTLTARSWTQDPRVYCSAMFEPEAVDAAEGITSNDGDDVWCNGARNDAAISSEGSD